MIEDLELRQSVPNVWRLPDRFQYPMDVVLQDLDLLLERVPFDQAGQILLTSHESTNPNPYQFAGSLYSYEKKEFIKREEDFCYFNDLFKDLIFFEIYKNLQEFSPFPIGRVRLMKLKPKSCYSMHKDDGIRYHMALKTHEQSFLIFKESGAVHIPANGCVYGTNTLKEHSAMNGSSEERIHLVFSTTWNPEAGKNFLKIVNQIPMKK